MAVTPVKTSRLGAEPDCKACGAGAIVSFNWALANGGGVLSDEERVAPFAHWTSLRRGSLYRCTVCDEAWHLDGREQTMTHVSAARLNLILEWDRRSINLTPHLMATLEQIGPTPPDLYGNRSDRRVTPCKVITTAGEVVDPAMVCVQLDAPVEEHMHFRLGHEVAAIRNSAFALPHAVRLASSRAEEMR